jgi:hypothetical protein
VGRLGLFELTDFLDAQRCAWIKRSLNTDELWKVYIYVKNYGCIMNCKAENINKMEFPVIYTICHSFERLTQQFTTTNENFNESYIFENKMFTRALETKAYLNRNMFSNVFFSENATRLYRMKYCNFYDNNDNLFTIEEVRANTMINFSVQQIVMMRGVCSVAKIKYKKKRGHNAKKYGH